MRKRRDRTLTGRKKRGRDAIQRSCSGARPPPGTTQWTWGVELQALAPGVQHGQAADLGPEMGGVGRDLAQCAHGGAEEDRERDALVLAGRWRRSRGGW